MIIIKPKMLVPCDQFYPPESGYENIYFYSNNPAYKTDENFFDGEL